MRTVLDLKTGEQGIVRRIHGRGPLKRRFSDMGITKGTSIKVTKIAPLGDPIQVNLLGYELSVRKEDACEIEIE
ncbi:MAG: ferrous iron transport protein A [Clostridiaceae bacterium]|jgi:ferrous iron transport protein A|nr:ferrous iron transport protein A [Clostridiaceae bacterium]